MCRCVDAPICRLASNDVCCCLLFFVVVVVCCLFVCLLLLFCCFVVDVVGVVVVVGGGGGSGDDDDDTVTALYDDVKSSLSSSSSLPWLNTTQSPMHGGGNRQPSPGRHPSSFPRPTSPPSQPLPAGWIISPHQHHYQQQQQQQQPPPTPESLHVVHNMSGILAFFDKCVIH